MALRTKLTGVIAALFVAYAVVALFHGVNALRRPVEPGHRLPPLWLPAMVVSELAGLVFVSRVVATAVFGAMGAFTTTAGLAGLAIMTAAQLAVLPQFARTRAARRQASGPLPPVAGWKGRLLGRPDTPPDIVLDIGVRYHEDLTLDLYRSPRHPSTVPVLIYVHGGSWRGGDPHNAGRIMFHTLARGGWAVATIRYPLSPAATFPDHLIGVKRAIAWIRAHGAEHGLDADRIAIAGGSAGGHLAALTALTADRRELQPGFEEVDTSVAACVPLYAIFDFVNRNRARWDWPLIPREVMKARVVDDPERYALASPLDQVGPNAPPFLVIHGASDSLVPPREARIFVDALRAASREPVDYLEVVGAQHAFDAIASVRTRAVVTRIQSFLEDAMNPVRRRGTDAASA